MKADKNLLIEQFRKVWPRDKKMVDYCVGKVAAVAILPCGGIVTVDKQQIEKDFCFGESGYDYDEAQRMAAHARTSESYFKRENMAHFRSWLKELAEAMQENEMSSHPLVIYEREYYGQTQDCRLKAAQFENWGQINRSADGCTVRGNRCRIATKEDIKAILEAYKEAAAAHEKKVDAYLKRYGTSKVHSWTYWRDA